MAEQRPPSPNYPPERPDKDYYDHEKEKEQWEHERSPSRRSLSRSSPRGDEAPNDGDTLHISNLPKDFSEENLKKLFSIYGNVVSVSIPKDPRTSIGRGFGFVRMETSEEAGKAMQGIQTSYPEYSVELSRRSKPRSSTPGQYLGSEKNRRSNKVDMRRYDYDRHYDRRSYRDYEDRERYDRLYRPSSGYRSVERNYDRSYGDRYHKSYDRSYSSGYDDYEYHRGSPYSDYPYDDRYRGYPERDRYYRYGGAPYHRPPHDDHHHHHHGSPPHGRD